MCFGWRCFGTSVDSESRNFESVAGGSFDGVCAFLEDSCQHRSRKVLRHNHDSTSVVRGGDTGVYRTVNPGTLTVLTVGNQNSDVVAEVSVRISIDALFNPTGQVHSRSSKHLFLEVSCC